jgi:hypothetical protein
VHCFLITLPGALIIIIIIKIIIIDDSMMHWLRAGIS